MKINIILALFSYVNFETNKNLCPKRAIDPQIQRLYSSDILKNSIILEEELLETDLLLSNLNPELTKNIILKSKLKNNQYLDSVSTLALRILTKLIIIWDDQLLQRKPLIYEYITMITHFDSEFTSSTIIKAIVRELLCILVNYNAQLDDACALMEMLIVSLHSQRTFVDIFLKNSSESTNYQQDSFLTFVRNFFNSDVENYKPLLIKVIIFLYEVFQREPHYKSFIESIRSDNTLMNSIFSKIFRTLTPNYSLVYRLNEYGSLNKQVKTFDIKNPAYQLEKLMIEGLVMQECSNLFAIVIAIRFLTQELIKSSEKGKTKSNISIAIKEFFSGFFSMWIERFKQQGARNPADERAFKDFLEALKSPENLFVYDEALNEDMNTTRSMGIERDLSATNLSIRRKETNRGFISISEIKRYQRRKQKQLDDMIREEGEASASKIDFIVLKSLYKILDINLYGYGKDFLYDTQEIFFALRSNRYKDDFIYFAVMFLNKQNLLNSVLTLEHKYFEAMITLFKFISTLGLTGKAFSSTYYHFSLISPEIYAKPVDEVFDNDNERFIANPNSKISFPLGFADFFTRVNETDPLEKKIAASTDFLEKVVRIIWNAIKENDTEFEISLPIIKSLEQKVNFLTYAFNALFYLMQTSKAFHAKNAKQAKAKNPAKTEIEVENLARLDRGLGEVIREIYYSLNPVLWARVIEAYRALDIDISPYVIFQLTFLHCVKENAAELNLETKEITSYLEILEIFVKANVNCLSLIISCLEILFKIDPVEFERYLVATRDGLIKALIVKIMHDNFHDIEFAFVMRLFTNLASYKETAKHLKDNNLIWELYSNKKLKALSQMTDYENGQRNPYQILWCWMLVLMRQLLETLHDEAGKYFYTFYLIRRFHKLSLEFLEGI